MSMHEIEDLQEDTIRVLDRIEGLDHRSMFKRVMIWMFTLIPATRTSE